MPKKRGIWIVEWRGRKAIIFIKNDEDENKLYFDSPDGDGRIHLTDKRVKFIGEVVNSVYVDAFYSEE